ncbi:MAG: MFS transporter [Halofilum sp. (in: g-proteobacteria)]|nr:MFS transporter [Halofilum sp. (in: g-proteobacteria)]
MHYTRFLITYRRFLAFGFLLPFFSGFGQTFFIGIFGAELRADFGLGSGDFGLIYSLATLANAAALVWLGRLIDRVDLRLYTVVTCITYVGACLYMAFVPALPLLLFVGFFLLRLTGQGLMSHIGVTTMGRHFDAGRGTAVSVANAGFPAAEALFPPLGVALLALLGWRHTWLAIGVVLALLLVPLVLWLLRGHGEREQQRRTELDAHAAASGAERSWLLSEVLRDPHFYRVLPAMLVTPFAVTGLFFHQAALAADKGWTLAWFASAFVVYALAQIAGTLASGPLVDRAGAARLLPFFLLPIAAGLGPLAGSDAAWVAPAFMLGAGLTAGAGMTLLGALWAEMYGVLHLGAIRSLTWALVVFASALAPALFGYLMDAGTGVEAIAGGCLVAALVSGGLAGMRRLPRGFTRNS